MFVRCRVASERATCGVHLMIAEKELESGPTRHPNRTCRIRHKNRHHREPMWGKQLNWMLAERAGFEPALGSYPKHAFQACDLNRSSTSPEPGILPEARRLPPQREAPVPHRRSRARVKLLDPSVAPSRHPSDGHRLRRGVPRRHRSGSPSAPDRPVPSRPPKAPMPSVGIAREWPERCTAHRERRVLSHPAFASYCCHPTTLSRKGKRPTRNLRASPRGCVVFRALTDVRRHVTPLSLTTAIDSRTVAPASIQGDLASR